MSVPAWPNTLPQRFLRDGYTEDGADNLIATDMSIGPAKTRRRSTAAVEQISGIVMMSENQFSAFKAFVKADTKDRSLPFTFPDPHGGAALLVRMPHPYSISPVGIEWRVQISLEVLP